MSNRKEISQDSGTQEPALSQQELEPKVKGLFNDFRQTLIEDPQFKKNLAETFLSTYGSTRSTKKGYLPVSLSRGLDKWVVRYFLEEKKGVLLECLRIDVYRPSEHTRGFRIVTLSIPYLSDRKDREKDDVDISYDQRSLLISPTPTDIHHNKTASAITAAEQTLADLKSPLTLKS